MSEGRTQSERSLHCCVIKWYCRACPPLSVSTLFCIYKFIRQSGAVYCVVTGTRNTPYKLIGKTFGIH